MAKTAPATAPVAQDLELMPATADQQAQAPAPYAPPAPPMAVEGMEDWDATDFVVPRMRIIQPSSKEGTQGKFSLNLSGEEFDSVNVVLIRVDKTRIMFEKGDLSKGPICGSLDRSVPDQRFENPMSESCGNCPYAPWEGKTPPPCNESLTLLFLDIDTGIPFFISFKSKALAPTAKFVSFVGFAARQKRMATYDFKSVMSTKLVVNDKGKFYIPVFTSPVFLPDRPYRSDANWLRAEKPRFDDEPAPASDDAPF